MKKLLSEESVADAVDHFRLFKRYLLILIIYSVVEFLYEHYLEELITSSQVEPDIWAKLINVGLDLLLLFIIKLIYLGFCKDLYKTYCDLSKKELNIANFAFIIGLVLSITVGALLIVEVLFENSLPDWYSTLLLYGVEVFEILIAICQLVGWINFGNFFYGLSHTQITPKHFTWFRTGEILIALERAHKIIFHMYLLYETSLIESGRSLGPLYPGSAMTFFDILIGFEFAMVAIVIVAYLFYYKGVTWLLHMKKSHKLEKIIVNFCENEEPVVKKPRPSLKNSWIWVPKKKSQVSHSLE